MTTWRQTFKVEGMMGRFPVDMLRYDYCYPTTTEDALEITSGDNTASRVTVSLSRSVDRKDIQPTAARWASFGWRLVEGSVRTFR